MFSRDSILAQMRERVHHPAGVLELLQLLRVPRVERATFKRQLNALVDSGDLVQVRGQRFGLAEKMDLYVGRLQRDEEGRAHVVPFDRRVLIDIAIPPGQERGANPTEMVTVELTRWPAGTRSAMGRVASVLGDIDAPGVDTEIIINKFGIPD